jgi:exodeoxyribonuclease VII large subunit
VADAANTDRKSAERRGGNVAEFSVSDLSNAVKRALEGQFGHVRLRGEISGYRGPHSSGHCYFALKDDKAKIEAVIWRGVFGSLRFKPEEGMEVIATGKVSSFPGSSKYQIVIEALEPAGVGALMALLEERKKKLAAEGLFEEARKKKIPFLPRVVGIVTSPTGAVIRDMLHGFNERFPAHVLVWPVRVQGETCAPEVAAAIRGFNALAPGGPIPRPDVLIVARGGGSLEDLWGFNEEIVARAAAASTIPLISAVGHETDWTLIDLVADARAPTPTKAAEWAVPKYSELLEQSVKFADRLRIALRRRLESARSDWRAAARGLPKLADLVALPRQRFDAAGVRLSRGLSANTQAHAKRLARLAPRLQPRLLAIRLERGGQALDQRWQRVERAFGRSAALRRTQLDRTAVRFSPRLMVNRIERWRSDLSASASLLNSLSYQSVLRRGFALVRDSEGHAIRKAHGVTQGQALRIEFADGAVIADVTRSSDPAPRTAPPDDSSPRRARAPRPGSSGKGGGGQGSLF